MQRLQEMRREAAGSIILPESGGAGMRRARASRRALPGGGKIRMP
jgi:hypothetical protein